MSKHKHPVLEGFGKWLAINILFIMVIWVPGPLQRFNFVKTLVSNFGSNYYDFFFFWWFTLFLGSFLMLVVWPSIPRRSYLK